MIFFFYFDLQKKKIIHCNQNKKKKENISLKPFLSIGKQFLSKSKSSIYDCEQRFSFILNIERFIFVCNSFIYHSSYVYTIRNVMISGSTHYSHEKKNQIRKCKIMKKDKHLNVQLPFHKIKIVFR